MLGTCDICGWENTEVTRGYVTGIETYACRVCSGQDYEDEQLRQETEAQVTAPQPATISE